MKPSNSGAALPTANTRRANAKELQAIKLIVQIDETDGWEKIAANNFMHLIGQVWVKAFSKQKLFGFVAEPKHLNRNKTVHGGMLVSLLDHALGQACADVTEENALLSTIQINTHFISTAKIDDHIISKAEVIEKTKSLIFVRGQCQANGKTILSGEGVFKISIYR